MLLYEIYLQPRVGVVDQQYEHERDHEDELGGKDGAHEDSDGGDHQSQVYPEQLGPRQVFSIVLDLARRYRPITGITRRAIGDLHVASICESCQPHLLLASQVIGGAESRQKTRDLNRDHGNPELVRVHTSSRSCSRCETSPRNYILYARSETHCQSVALCFIHRSAWKGNSQKFVYEIVHSPGPTGLKLRITSYGSGDQ